MPAGEALWNVNGSFVGWEEKEFHLQWNTKKPISLVPRTCFCLSFLLPCHSKGWAAHPKYTQTRLPPLSGQFWTCFLQESCFILCIHPCLSFHLKDSVKADEFLEACSCYALPPYIFYPITWPTWCGTLWQIGVLSNTVWNFQVSFFSSGLSSTSCVIFEVFLFSIIHTLREVSWPSWCCSSWAAAQGLCGLECLFFRLWNLAGKFEHV